MADALTPSALADALAGLPGWSGDASALTRTYRFAGFPAAIAFMHACAPAIAQADHHPEWTNVYDRVSIRLTTHDAGSRVTARDVTLARLLDAAAREHGGR
jgi:4a-hydroxytetrahydrobiopterin dehydratase